MGSILPYHEGTRDWKARYTSESIGLNYCGQQVIGEEERKLVAFHESGHAVAASLLPRADPLDKVTIIPRGHALGVTEQIPEEERHNTCARVICATGSALCWEGVSRSS